jgi:hydroxyacyl-ACP dehydratase HTD2-like protein with hotdog domain
VTTHVLAGELEPGAVIAERDYVVDEVDLFLFSAVCWLPHRIHYDQDFARAEGLETAPVHGPLQATWLIQLAAEWAAQHGARVSSSAIRHVSSAYPRQRLRASVTIESVEGQDDDRTVVLELRLALPDGSPVTTGCATVVADHAGTGGPP